MNKDLEQTYHGLEPVKLPALNERAMPLWALLDSEKLDQVYERAFFYSWFYGKAWYWIPAMFLFCHGDRRKCRKLAW